MRIDKWLWAARFFKTRTLAVEEIGKGRVHLNGHTIKPAHDVRPGDRVLVKTPLPRTVVVKGLSQQRGPAVLAQQLYEETEDSLRERDILQQRLRLQAEPAQAIEHGRPTKRDRRELSKTWDQRWSASLDD